MSDSLIGRALYINVNTAFGSFVDGKLVGQLSTDDAGNTYRWDGVTWNPSETTGAKHHFASAKTAAAVTPSDATVLDFNALYIGTAGDVSIELEDGTSVVFAGLIPGTILPVRGIGVNATGTTSGAARTGLIWLKW